MSQVGELLFRAYWERGSADSAEPLLRANLRRLPAYEPRAELARPSDILPSAQYLAMVATRRKTVQALDSTRELTTLIQQSCLVAKDAAFNLRDFLENSSNMAFIAVKDCEKELDRAERKVDEQITAAITQVSEAEARELLGCLKFIIDLERIGDLTWSVTQRLQRMTGRIQQEDRHDLISMAEILQKMLDNIYQGFLKRDVNSANWVLKTDTQIDHVCHAVFRRHLENKDGNFDYSTNVLLMAQAFERAGDHAKNLGEELFHLVEGHTMRHQPKRPKTSRQMQ